MTPGRFDLEANNINSDAPLRQHLAATSTAKKNTSLKVGLAALIILVIVGAVIGILIGTKVIKSSSSSDVTGSATMQGEGGSAELGTLSCDLTTTLTDSNSLPGNCTTSIDSGTSCSIGCASSYEVIGAQTYCSNGTLTSQQSCHISQTGTSSSTASSQSSSTASSSPSSSTSPSSSAPSSTSVPSSTSIPSSTSVPSSTSSPSSSTGADSSTASSPPPPTGSNFDASAPHRATLIDFTNEASPVTKGSFYFDTPTPDLVFDHPWLANSIGNISIVNSGQTVVHGVAGGQFEFGGILIAHNHALNDAGTNTPVYQVLIGGKPHNRWSTYPARRTFNRTTDIMHPPAFKFELYSATNVLLGRIELRDGLPVNSRTLSWVRNTTDALRPRWHIGQLLKWQNVRMKKNTNMRKWIGGFDPVVLRGSLARQQTSVNGAVGICARGVDMKEQSNGFQHWFAMPKWPLVWTDEIYNRTFDPSLDPYLYDFGSNYPSRTQSFTGWGYEPGAIGGHDHLTGPGGMRSERSSIATPYAIYYANETYTRPKADDDIRDMLEAWSDNYFNHGGYWITNLTSWSSLNMTQVHSSRWSFLKGYYGFQNDEQPPSDPTAWDSNIELWNACQDCYDGSPQEAAFYDRNGAPFWNGWGVDQHHSYQFAGYQTLMFSSGAHVFASRQGYIWNKLAWLSYPDLGKNDFMYRTMAFRWHHLVMQWILGNSHPVFGIDRTAIEDLFHRDLARIVDVFKHDHDVVAALSPASLTPQQLSDYAFVKFGSYLIGFDYDFRWFTPYPDGQLQARLHLTMSALGYYSTYMWAMMKTSGLWAKLRLNSKSATGLDFTMAKYDQYAFEKAIYAKSRCSWQDPAITPWKNLTSEETMYSGTDWKGTDIPNGWQGWAVANPANGTKEDWLHWPDGSIKGGEDREYSGMHIEVAYATMRRDYYPEVTHPLLSQVIAMYKKGYDEITNLVTSQTSTYEARSLDWEYLWPSLGTLQPPTVAV